MKLAVGWALIQANSDPIQEIEAKVGGGALSSVGALLSVGALSSMGTLSQDYVTSTQYILILTDRTTYSFSNTTVCKYPHCKNKLVVLTTERLPWLQTSWRDSGYERFALVWKPNCIRQPKMQLPSSSYNHNTLTTFRTSVKESLQMHFKVVVRTFHALNVTR